MSTIKQLKGICRVFIGIACFNALYVNCVGKKNTLVIQIHGITTEIDSTNACSVTQWTNKPIDACECCLVQTYDQLSQKKSANDIIASCKSTKQCTDATLATLKKEKKITGSSEKFLTALYDDAVVVRPMQFDISLLGPKGIFTETSLPQFLAQAFKEKKLANPDFSKAECLKAKNLGTQGGYNTLQLFLVSSTCAPSQASMYIVKGAREGLDEAIKLKEVENIPKMKEIIAPRVVAGLPSIALPLAYFSYPDASGLQYIAAMPAAKGKVLSELVTNFNKDQSPQNKEMLIRAFTVLGKETAQYHKRFAKPVKGKVIGDTIAHGDFHFFNLFFDPIGAHYTFIDNETMAKSIKERVSPAVDLVKLFFMPFSINSAYQQFRDLIDQIDLRVWFEVALRSFVIGYLQAYNQNEQKKAREELQKMFNDPFYIPWVDFYEEQLQELRAKYINPIFKQLSNAKAQK